MGKNGCTIPCPKGGVKKPKLLQTEATRQKAERDRANSEWGQRRCEEIIQAINPPPPHPEDPGLLPDLNHYEDIGNDLNHDSDDEAVDNEVIENQLIPANLTQLITGDKYKQQRIQEDAQWMAIMQQVFIAFMQGSQRTSSWGNDSLWSHDYNDEELCSCGPSHKQTREVDTIDLISFLTDDRRISGRFQSSFIGARNPRGDTWFSMISNIPRLWRKPLTGAVTCYRQILKGIEELENRALNLTPLEQLAANCPRCFGPSGECGIQKGPQYIVCVDGNFQQRRHEKASRNFEEISLSVPSIFIPAAKLAEWEPQATANVQTEVPLDPCTQQHTAAEDRRNASSWKGSEETGLIGLACRHDHMIKMVNVIRSGEKAYFVHALLGELFASVMEAKSETNKAGVGLLYDIGCTLEKGVIKNNLFINERSDERLKFGTSAFHAYVHQWSCQLQYNPRLNACWGLSDGEGLEREWFKISPLISALRWASSQTRMDALHLKLQHNNCISRNKAAKSVLHKLKVAETRLSKARSVLRDLESVEGLTVQYLSEQWERQKTCQLKIMENSTMKDLQVQVARLIELEEDFIESHEKLKKLRRQRRRTMSQEEHEALRELPSTLVALEESIAEITTDLGGDAYRDLPEVDVCLDPCARNVMKIRIAKEKLYEAAVGKIEWQKKWDRPGIGTTEQPRYKRVMETRNKALAQKYNTYKTLVQSYHRRYPDRPALQLPLFEEVKALDIADPFWNIGHLTHPEEAWAVDRSTQLGIEAFRSARSSDEETERISCEVQHMMRSGLQMAERLSALYDLSQLSWEVKWPGVEIELGAKSKRTEGIAHYWYNSGVLAFGVIRLVCGVCTSLVWSGVSVPDWSGLTQSASLAFRVIRLVCEVSRLVCRVLVGFRVGVSSRLGSLGPAGGLVAVCFFTYASVFHRGICSNEVIGPWSAPGGSDSWVTAWSQS
ncbi:hypothetical protein DFH28DRAFT_932317 [Melampsora americana]|nr:hypothetical protein DFH28DRAFT_932317 [Melampsora americana]